MKGSFLKSCLIFTCVLAATAAMSTTTVLAHNYDEEVQTQQLLSRHWDESELKERFENFLNAVKNKEGIEDYIAPDITEEEKEFIRNYFRPFEGKSEISYVHTKMPVLHRVSGTDEYNDLRGLMELKFRVRESKSKLTEYTVILKMARLGDASSIKWKIYGILWNDKGVDVSDVKLYQLDKPKRGEQVCIMTTDAGVIKMRLFPEKAPLAVKNWIELSKQGFYNGRDFYRVIKGFVIQSGSIDGNSDENTTIYNSLYENEVSSELHNFNGALCLANGGPHTNGNQFYIVQSSAVRNEEVLPLLSLPENVKAKYKEVGGIPELDGRYTVFGQVYEGLDIVEKIASQETDAEDAPLSNPIKVQKIEFKKYR